MRPNIDEDRSNFWCDFFISYSPLDIEWATWIAWELESAGYRIMMQAWDFTPGKNFIDFIDRGIRNAHAVIAVLTPNYMRSTYGRLEWQAAYRSAPANPESRLITVRVEDFLLEGLLATITFVDLASISDPATARDHLLTRVADAVDGRAKPTSQPPYPTAGDVGLTGPSVAAIRQRQARSVPAPFPPHTREKAARAVRLLHLFGPRFGGSGEHDHLIAEFIDMIAVGLGDVPADAVVISGGLTSRGRIREFDEALRLVHRIRTELRIPVHRIAVVPGPSDVNPIACLAYFTNCEADDVSPRPPYWPKWRHFTRFFEELYDGVDGVSFTEETPWSLFEMADIRLVVGGLNSTMPQSHLPEHSFGAVGEEQARWFRRRLTAASERDMFRVGVVYHSPVGPDHLRDAATFDTIVAPHLDLVLTGAANPEALAEVYTISGAEPLDKPVTIYR